MNSSVIFIQSSAQLTQEERVVYEWQYNLDGGFRHTLMDAISKADEENIEKLKLGFPVQVSAYERFTHEKGWFESIQHRMGN